MNRALEAIRRATENTPYEGALWLVGGAVRDLLIGLEQATDFDIVLEGSSSELAKFLFENRVSTIAPVVYPRFGTALVRVAGEDIELVTARRESYEGHSRKPSVKPATLEEDALRRDFTVNTLLLNVHTNEIRDPLGSGFGHLVNRILQTPLDPDATFHDDPLRMLRAVRFRWKLGFEPAEGLYESIREQRERLKIISAERIRDEMVKMLRLPDADRCMADLMETGLFEVFAPEFCAMVPGDPGAFHHLNVWEHTLLALRNAGSDDLMLSLAILLHDVGKPETRIIDEKRNTRFFGHEAVSASIARKMLRRLKFPSDDIDTVCLLVKNHMRLNTATTFTATAARRLIRDIGPQLDRLLSLVEADASALRPGVKELDLAGVKARVAEVSAETPRETLASPLSGAEIMALLEIGSGPTVGRLKAILTEKVLDGALKPDDKEGAERIVREQGRPPKRAAKVNP
jgi:poly(A) polymerase